MQIFRASYTEQTLIYYTNKRLHKWNTFKAKLADVRRFDYTRLLLKSWAILGPIFLWIIERSYFAPDRIWIRFDTPCRNCIVTVQITPLFLCLFSHGYKWLKTKSACAQLWRWQTGLRNIWNFKVTAKIVSAALHVSMGPLTTTHEVLRRLIGMYLE